MTTPSRVVRSTSTMMMMIIIMRAILGRGSSLLSGNAKATTVSTSAAGFSEGAKHSAFGATKCGKHQEKKHSRSAEVICSSVANVTSSSTEVSVIRGLWV